MQAWHNDPSIRQRCINAVSTARETGKLIHGCYRDPHNGKGCAVGQMAMSMGVNNSLTSSPMIRATAESCGLPIWLGVLIESIYEQEPRRYDGVHSKPGTFSTERALRAIPVGFDLPATAPDCLGVSTSGPLHGVLACRGDVRALGSEVVAERLEQWVESLLAKPEKPDVFTGPAKVYVDGNYVGRVVSDDR